MSSTYCHISVYQKEERTLNWTEETRVFLILGGGTQSKTTNPDVLFPRLTLPCGRDESFSQPVTLLVLCTPKMVMQKWRRHHLRNWQTFPWNMNSLCFLCEWEASHGRSDVDQIQFLMKQAERKSLNSVHICGQPQVLLFGASTSVAASNKGCRCVVMSAKRLGKEKVPPDEMSWEHWNISYGLLPSNCRLGRIHRVTQSVYQSNTYVARAGVILWFSFLYSAFCFTYICYNQENMRPPILHLEAIISH